MLEPTEGNMKFKNGDMARIHSTNSPLDGLKVRILGIAYDAGASQGSIYIIHGIFEHLPGEWDAIQLTESCLESCN